MKKSSLFLLLFLPMLLSAQKAPVKQTQTKPAIAADEPQRWKVNGMIFNDLMYVVTEPSTANPAKAVSGRFASTLRRAALGFDVVYSGNVNGKIVYDGAANVLRQGYVEVRNLMPQFDLKAGLMQTIGSEAVDKIWSYRSMDMSVLDRKGLTQEFDMGLTMTARFDPQGGMYTRLAVYNGSGTAPENDKLKKVALGGGYWLSKSSLMDLLVDYENFPAGRSVINAKLFYGMNGMEFGGGAEAFYSMKRKFAVTKDVVPAGVSVFGWFAMMKQLRGVLRLDVVDQDMNATVNTYQEIYVNTGLDYAPVPEVRLIPNVMYVKNIKKGTGVEIKDYIMARLTTAIYFK